MVGIPLNVVVALKEPPPVTVQRTPELLLSFATVAAKDWPPPALRLALVGEMLTEMGFTVMAAVADLVGSAMLVAARVTVVVAVMPVAGDV